MNAEGKKIRKEIEAAAIKTVECPSCGAEPGDYCRLTKGRDPCEYRPTTATHQRRLSTFVVVKMNFSHRN